MPKRPSIPYQYQSGDSPLSVAQQHGISPQQVIDANPGGYPFSTGQNINIPQFGPPAPVNQGVVGPAQFGPPRPGVPPVGYGPQKTNTQQPFSYGSAYVPTSSAITHTFPWLAGSQPTALPESTGTPFAGTQQIGTMTPTTTTGAEADAANSDYANTRAAQYYAANGTPFLNQKRWDPQAKKYVSIGRLLKQGKLDLKGNWHKQSNRQRITAAVNRKKGQEQQQQDMTLSNSIINFSASAG